MQAEGSLPTGARRPLFDAGVTGRLRTRAVIVAAWVIAAIPAGVFRGYADNIGLPVHRHFNAVESVVFWDGPSRGLQALLLDVVPLQHIAVWIYGSWFFLPLFATLPLVGGPPRRYWRLLAVMMLTYYAGMPFFALYPLEPPWAHSSGIAHVLALVNSSIANKDDNPFAALPSLHVALPAAAALWYGVRTPLGKGLLGYSLLISVTVMYTGDHYLADVVAGYALAASVTWVIAALGLPLRDDASPSDRVPVRAAGQDVNKPLNDRQETPTGATPAADIQGDTREPAPLSNLHGSSDDRPGEQVERPMSEGRARPNHPSWPDDSAA